jgi:hypothetical protein
MLGPDPALLCPQWGDPVMFSRDFRSDDSCDYAVAALRGPAKMRRQRTAVTAPAQQRVAMTATASTAALVRHAPRPTAGGICG